MKLKNLYLGLEDQMPLRRFIRNLHTGNALGLFFKRSHFTQEGRPKISYSTKEKAIKAAQKMKEKNGNYYSNYKCIFCDGYHIGRNKT
jgi:hypothetical protein